MAFMKESKDTLTAFMNLHHTVMSEGAVTVKNKELIALGISIAARCDGCIAAHVKAALASNATRAEIVETINSFSYFDEKQRQNLLKFVEEFYQLTEKPDYLINIMKRECRDAEF